MFLWFMCTKLQMNECVDNRKRQSSVAQRMLENREVRRRQPVLAGRASPLSPSLHRVDPFSLSTPEVMPQPHCLLK